ncbi:MAG: phage holin family protein [Coleofasciculaceae cyanobacterium RL_1_1]|nr:phage holin family protein [Coleofasciculaceae cyanobacterium RL_1_1]
MPQFLITWLLSALAIALTAYIVPGLAIEGATAAIIAAAILGLVNAVVRPLLIFATLPLTLVSFGAFLLVINAISIWLVGAWTAGFTVNGFFPALLGSIVLSFISSLLNQLANRESEA